MIIVRITGASGSGKNTLAHKLKDYYGDRYCQIIYTNTNQKDVSTFSKEIVILVGNAAFEFEGLPEHETDVKIYVETDLDLCLARRLKKALSIEPHESQEIITDYLQSGRDFYIQHISPMKQAAHCIINNNVPICDINIDPLIELVSNKLNRSVTTVNPHIISPTFDAAQNKSTVQGTLFILSGPSGVGKSTLIKRVLERNLNINKLIPYTTRTRRATEIDGVDYHFISHALFAEKLSNTPFLQHYYDEDANNHYGIPLPEVIAQLASGRSLIMDVAPDVLSQVRKQLPNIRSIFICPPSMTALMERVIQRDAGPDEKRYRRSIQMFERASYNDYDYLVVNSDLGKATDALASIISEKQSQLQQQQHVNSDLLKRFKIFNILLMLRESIPAFKMLDMEAVEVTSLSSLSNSSYKLSSDHMSYFLRIVRKNNEAYRISLQDEQNNLAQASALGLYPQTIHYDPNTGIYVVPYLQNYHMLTPQVLRAQETTFKAMICAIRKLHNSVLLLNDYQPLHYIESNLIKLKERNIRLPADIDNIAVICHRIMDLLASPCQKRVPCHNDITPYNLLYRNDHVIISDWECSGNNDPLWDLAKLSVEAQFDSLQDESLLKIYYENDVKPIDQHKLALFKLLIEFHLAIWAKWQVMIHNDAALEHQFETMFLVRLDNCRKHIDAPAFKNHLSMVLLSVKRVIDLPRMQLSRVVRYSNITFQSLSSLPIMSHTEAENQLAPVSGVTSCFDNKELAQSLIILKPDVQSKKIIGKVIQQLEETLCLNVIGLKLKELTIDDVEKLYTNIDKHPLRFDILDLMTSGPIVIIVVEGLREHILKLPEYKGSTDPRIAREGTLRKLFGTNAKFNAVHCSDDIEVAKREIDLFFAPEEIFSNRQLPSVASLIFN